MKADPRRLEWAIRRARVTVALVSVPLAAVTVFLVNAMMHPRPLVFAIAVIIMLASLALGIWLMGPFARFVFR